jgi:plasmid stabilization system protein ParE
MSAKRVEYHQGAVADVKSAVAWYQRRSPKVALDFIEELHRAADTIREAPERWPLGRNNTRRFLLWRFPFSIIYSAQEYNLGRRSRQQATGVLGAPPLTCEFSGQACQFGARIAAQRTFRQAITPPKPLLRK